jgi:hypothetical protein
MYIYLFVEGQKLVAHPTRLHMESDEKAWDFGLWLVALSILIQPDIDMVIYRDNQKDFYIYH